MFRLVNSGANNSEATRKIPKYWRAGSRLRTRLNVAPIRDRPATTSNTIVRSGYGSAANGLTRL